MVQDVPPVPFDLHRLVESQRVYGRIGIDRVTSAGLKQVVHCLVRVCHLSVGVSKPFEPHLSH